MNMHWNPAFLHADPGRRGVSIGFVLAALALAASLLLGGASRTNAYQVASTELLSLPALLWAVWRLSADGAWKAHRFAFIILAAIVAIPLIQLIPMPPELWARWPGHAAAAEGLRAAGPEHRLAADEPDPARDPRPLVGPHNARRHLPVRAHHFKP